MENRHAAPGAAVPARLTEPPEIDLLAAVAAQAVPATPKEESHASTVAQVGDGMNDVTTVRPEDPAAAAAAASTVNSSDGGDPSDAKRVTLEKYEPDPNFRWKVEYIPLTVATSENDATPQSINLADTIGQQRDENGRHVNVRSKERFYLLPEHNQNTKEYRSKVLGPLFGKACAVTGSRVTIYGYEQRDYRLKFACFRCRKYRNYRNPKSKGMACTTLRAKDPKHTCKFTFHVLWDNTLSRWYVKKFGGGTRYHNAHGPEDFSSSATGIGGSSKAGSHKPNSDEMKELLRKSDPMSLAHSYISAVTRLIEEPEDMIRFQNCLVNFKVELQKIRKEREQQQQQGANHDAQKGPRKKRPPTMMETAGTAIAAIPPPLLPPNDGGTLPTLPQQQQQQQQPPTLGAVAEAARALHGVGNVAAETTTTTAGASPNLPAMIGASTTTTTMGTITDGSAAAALFAPQGATTTEVATLGDSGVEMHPSFTNDNNSHKRPFDDGVTQESIATEAAELGSKNKRPRRSKKLPLLPAQQEEEDEPDPKGTAL